jgi:hypothetical protein
MAIDLLPDPPTPEQRRVGRPADLTLARLAGNIVTTRLQPHSHGLDREFDGFALKEVTARLRRAHQVHQALLGIEGANEHQVPAAGRPVASGGVI